MPRTKGSRNKKQSEPTERIQGDLPVTLAREFKALCVRQGKTLTAAMREMVSIYVNHDMALGMEPAPVEEA